MNKIWSFNHHFSSSSSKHWRENALLLHRLSSSSDRGYFVVKQSFSTTRTLRRCSGANMTAHRPSGGGFMPMQATQTTDSGFSPAKALSSLTVKQISEAHQMSDDKSNFVIDVVYVNNITLVGMVTGKLEKVTVVSFHLDDDTGCIEVHRWQVLKRKKVDDAVESNAMAELQNGTYVCVHGHLKVFQGKKQVAAYSCRAEESGVHVVYVVERLGIPKKKVM